MKTYFLSLVIALLAFNTVCFSQISKNGARTITAANSIVNEYTTLTSNASAGTTTLQVASSTLNANGRFSSALSAGDLIMIIQIQGASLLGTASGTITIPNNSTWGEVTSYNNCGNYEFAQVYSVPNGTSIVIDCGLQHDYTSSGKVQIVRVPRYSSLTVNSGASVTCDPWNGSTGGIVAVESGTVTVNGSIVATGKGFRGGLLTGNDAFWNLTNYATISTDGGGEKGEGIFGYQAEYNVLGGSIGRGAPGNGGGGANGWTTGGGGGANAGNISGWNGQGNPDISTASWANAWNLESPGFSTNVSSGGGRGGYSWSSSNQNATTTAPGNTGWGGDNRMNHGGLGGRPLDYSTGKIFLGGGGGGGDQDNNFGGVGGQGGGLIFIHAYNTVGGSGTIVSNGAPGTNATGTPPSGSFSGKDGAGGGGAGGTILIRSQGVSVSLSANGGAGGNQVIVKAPFVFTVNEAEGPGGGGGGGYIGLSAGTPAQTVSGGANGTTNSDGLTEFLPNGATRGGAGLSGQSLNNYTLTAVNASVCSGSTASLSVTVTGTLPGGAQLTWYDSETGGSEIGYGATYNTPALFSTTTYYVGVCPGFYRIPVVVTIVPGITVNVSPVNSTVCPGASVALAATGGTTYTWTPSAGLNSSTGANVTATVSATTTYTVTGSTGSCTDTSVAIITMGATPVINVSPASDTLCAGTSVNLVASGGIAYTWSPGGSLSATNTASVVASPTTTTTYTVTGTNSSGCTATATVPVTVFPVPVVTVSPSVSTICSGSSVVITASGASTYSWSPSSTLNSSSGTTVTASPLTTTTYTVTGTSSGCTAAATSIVNVTSNPSVTVSPVSSAMCSGGSTALTASGASAYSWSPATGLSATSGASVGASPSTTTTYTVTGTASGCTDTALSIVSVLPVPVITVSPVNTTICSGSAVVLTASGGTSYSWSPSTSLNNTNSASVTATPSSTITYTVTGTSSGGCSDTAVAIVQVNTTPVVSVSPSSQSLCAGGTATITASGASTYTWSPSASLNTSTGSTVISSASSTQTYTVTGTSSGCVDTATAIVNVAGTITVAVNPSNSSICSGSSVALTATGASSYSWSPSTGLSGTTGSTVTSDAATTVTYTITGTSGSCSDTAFAVVNVSPAAVFTMTVSDTSICSGETVAFDVTGNSTYTWTGPALSSGSGASVTASPLSTSTYTVVGTLGICSATLYQEIDVEASPVVSVTPPSSVLCAGSSVVLSASGASGYMWGPSAGLSSTTGASVTASPSVSTTYTLTGINGNCADTATAEVIVSGSLTASVSSSAPDVCEGDTLTLNASGGTTYSWEPSAGLSNVTGSTVQASPSSTTTYTVVASSGSCTDTAEVIVKVNTVPVVSVTSGTDTICSGSSTILSATGAATYIWSPAASLSSATDPNVTATPSSTQTYTVIGYNLSCSDTAELILEVESLPVITITTSDDTLCPGNSATLTASGAGSFLWSPGSGLSSTTGSAVVASPSSTMTYTATGTSGNCLSTSVIEVFVEQVTISASQSSVNICEGESTTVTLSGADSYLFAPSSGVTASGGSSYTLDPLSSTVYEIIGSSSGCSDTISVTVNVDPLPVLTIVSGTQTICKGSSVTATVSGATDYIWSPASLVNDPAASTVIASPLTTTTFTVTGSSGNCSSYDTLIIQVNEVTITASASPAVICSGMQSTLNVTGATNYSWSPSADLSSLSGSTVTATPAASSTYTVTGTDLNGCTDTAEVSVTVNQPAVVSAGSDVTTCQTTLTLSATDPAPDSGTWSVISGSGSLSSMNDPLSSVTGLSTGITELVWSVSNACGTLRDTVRLTVTSGPSLVVSAAPATICEGASSVLSATASGGDPAYTYSWSDGSSGSSVTVSPGVTTVYSVIATDASGCQSDVEQVTVSVGQGLQVDAGADVTITKGESTQLSATGSQTYSWSPTTNLASPDNASTLASPDVTTVFTVTGTDANGCISSDEVTVTVIEKSNVFIPDIFSPNNDGRNDILYVRGGNISSFRFLVFDRWGERVFETSDQSFGWDGTYRGSPMDEAVYVFILKGTYLDGSVFEINGNVTLLR